MNSTSKKRLIEGIIFTFGIIFVFVIYQIFATIKQNTAYNKETMSLLVPNVNTILKAFFNSLGEGKTYKAILFTFLNLCLALFIGGAIGIILGVLGGINNKLNLFFRPLMAVLRCAPVVILVFILVVAVKAYFVPAITTILVMIPIFYEGTENGIKSVDKDLIDAYKINSTFNFKVAECVYIPAIANYLKASFVTSVSFGLKVLISTEYLASTKYTMGYLMNEARGNMNYANLYAYLIIVLLIAFIIDLMPLIINMIAVKKNN